MKLCFFWFLVFVFEKKKKKKGFGIYREAIKEMTQHVIICFVLEEGLIYDFSNKTRKKQKRKKENHKTNDSLSFTFDCPCDNVHVVGLSLLIN